MAAATRIPVEEYLRTDDSPDCEDVDGEVLERNAGELDHKAAGSMAFGVHGALRTGNPSIAVPVNEIFD